MSEQNDGGPAFPCDATKNGMLNFAVGMSLRDWFAGQALGGFLASLSGIDHRDVMAGIQGGRRVSTAAYMYADAMLAERAKAEGRAP